MTYGSQRPLVGAIFPNRRLAAEAVSDLLSSGFAHDELATAEWLEGRYVIASDIGREMGRSLFWGGVIGVIVGAVAGALLTLAIWRSAGTLAALLVGAAFGGAIGWIFGAYFGLIRRRPELWDQQDWEHVEIEDGEVLIVMAEKESPGLVEEILERHGGRHVEPPHPQ